MSEKFQHYVCAKFSVYLGRINITFIGVKEVGMKGGGGGGRLSESVEKGKLLMTKIFFSDNVEWSSKNLSKMISADVKANKNNNK